MSSHIYDTSDNTKKPEHPTAPHPQQPQLAVINSKLVGQQARFAELLQNQTLHGALTAGAKPPRLGRPIAPAPGIVAAVSVSGAKILTQPQHAMVQKAVGNIEAISLQPGGTTTQTVAVNLSTQAQPTVSQAASQGALHITMTSVSSQSLHPLTIPANLNLGHVSTAGLVQAQGYAAQVSGAIDKDKPRVTVMAPGSVTDTDRIRTAIPMSSLIRSTTLPQSVHQAPGGQVSLALAHTHAGTVQSQTMQGHGSIIQALPPSHIPRGAAAASALASAKVGTIATPILRPHTVSTTNPLAGVGASIGATNNLLPTIAQLQPRTVLPLRSGTPPVTQIVSVTTAGHNEGHRGPPGHVLTTLAGNSAVQISSLPGRVVPGAKPGGLPLPQGFTQKVVVSQSMSQLLTPQTAGTAGGPTGSTLVSVNNPKFTGHQNLAMNLAQAPAGLPRGQKIITTPVSSLPTPSQVSIATNLGGQAVNLGQAIPRGKVVITQAGTTQGIPPGAVVVNTGAKTGPAALNVGHAITRPSKVIMSHVAVSTPTTVPITIATIPKTITQLGLHGNTLHHGATMASTTTVTSTAKKVKVQAQRPTQPLVTMAASHLQHQHPHPDQSHTQPQPHPHPPTHREVGVAPPQAATKVPVVGQGWGVSTQSVPPNQVQAGLFGQAAQSKVAISGTAVSLPVTGTSTTQSDTRTVAPERQGIQPQAHLPFPLSEYSANYYNLVYPLSAGSPLRPGLVAGQQQPNLATLQAATQNVTMASSTQPGVRLNTPVVVNMDHSHHSAISLATQFAAAKGSEVPQLPTTTVAVNPPVSATHPHNLIPTTISQAPNQQAGGIPHGAHTINQQPTGIISQPPNSSPRPSILRKRPHDGERLMIVKKNLLSSVSAAESSNSSQGDLVLHHIPAKTSIPCDPSRENSQSSTDTASSAESTPKSSESPEVKIKQEPLDSMENGAAAGLAMFSQIHNNNLEASPRKKPRKQQLHASEELKDTTSSDEELDKLARDDIKQELEWEAEDIKPDVKEFVDTEGIRWTREKSRPPISLLNHYACNWKTRNNHFLRYQDVKVKDERRPTVNELANQKAIHQKASGWKIYHLAAQLEELMDMEQDVFGNMSLVQECIAPKHIAKNPTMEDDISMVHELTQGNIQRCKLVMDQLEEARASMVKVLDHKKRIVDIINKHHSKRPVKKKERP